MILTGEIPPEETGEKAQTEKRPSQAETGEIPPETAGEKEGESI